MAAWSIIAKNEIRLWTTKFRNHRKLFFYVIVIIAAIFNVTMFLINVLFAAPFRQSDLFDKLFFSLVVIPKLPISQAEIIAYKGIFLYSNVFASLAILLIPPVLEMICYFIFFMSFTYPIQTSLQQLDISHFEVILSSPIKPRDMLLGNFLGRVPIYVLAVFFVVPIFWTVLSQFIFLPIISFFVFSVVFLALFVLGTFLGTITASYLSLKLGQARGGAENARAYIILIGIIGGIPIISLSMFPFAFIDPNVQFYIKFIPTTWFGDIINFTIYPGFISVETFLLFISLASLLYLAVFSLGYHYGDRFYSLELTTRSETIRIVEEHSVYKFLKRIFGSLFTIQFKEFVRRKENLFKLVYVMILSMIVPISTIFFSSMDYDLISTLTGDVLPVEYPMLMGGFVFAIIIGPMLGSFIMIRSKDMIWIFKKSPRGVSSLVHSYFQVNYFMIFFLTFPVVILVSLFTGYDLIYSVIFFIMTNIWVLSALAISIGIQCWRPAFKEKSPKMTINILISMAFFMGIFFFLMASMGPYFLYVFYLSPIILMIISILTLRVGIKKLESLE